MSEEVIVTQAEYVASAVEPTQYPAEKLPQVAFWGRSNVGKSSLINSLTRRRNLARVSGQPGKTQTINFFNINAKVGEERKNFHLVDLPGYGYAKTSKTNRTAWAKFIENYFKSSRELLFVCLLVDLRHEPMPIDLGNFKKLIGYGVAVLPIGTKADKVSQGERKKNIAAFKAALGIEELDILPYSSVKNEGRDELLDTIWQSLSEINNNN